MFKVHKLFLLIAIPRKRFLLSFSVINEGSCDSLNKIKILEKIHEIASLVAADITGLYLSIQHELWLNVVTKILDGRENRAVPSTDLQKMVKFVSENNYFEFNGDIEKQIYQRQPLVLSLHRHTCAYSWMVLKILPPVAWFRYIDDISFIQTCGGEILQSLFQKFLKAFLIFRC